MAVTDGEGQYSIDGLPAGDYSVSFSLPCFETAFRDGVTVADADSVTLDAVLQFAAFSEDVTVVGSKLDTGRQEFGTNVPGPVRHECADQSEADTGAQGGRPRPRGATSGVGTGRGTIDGRLRDGE